MTKHERLDLFTAHALSGLLASDERIPISTAVKMARDAGEALLAESERRDRAANALERQAPAMERA